MQLDCGGLDRTAVLRKIVSVTGLCLVVALLQPAAGQSTTVPAGRYSVSLFAAGASGSALPFWLSANQYGVVDPESANGGARVRAWRRTPDAHGLRFGYGLDVIGRASQHETAYAHELYGRLRYRPLQAAPGIDDGTPGVGNNTVIAQHVGLSGAFGSRLSYPLLGTYSRNYGAKRVCASPSCASFTDRRTARRDQWSMRLAVNGVLLPEYGLQFRAAAAVDVGEYYDDRAGGSLALIWRGAWGR